MSSDQKEPRTRYLVLGGIIDPDHRVELRPGFLTDNPHGAEEPARTPLTAELLDDDGRLLLRRRLPAGRVCGEGGSGSARTIFTGKVPWRPGARVVRLRWEGDLVHELRVSRERPEVALAWTPRDRQSGRAEVRWSGRHPEGLPLHYFLRYSNDAGASWRAVTLLTAEGAQELDFDELAGGDRCRLGVVATDGANTVMAESAEFEVPIKPCQALILSPAQRQAFDVGDAVWLTGQGYYLEERAAEKRALAWSSSLDGRLGSGPVLRVAGLSPGTHRITLSAGEGARAGEASVVVHVGKHKGEPGPGPA